MQYGRKLSLSIIALFLATATLSSVTLARDVPFVPTPEPVVREMLKLAKVGKDSLVYDLGSGDGRIVIMAAKEHAARGVGVDIDPERIAEAQANAKRAGVEDRVKFIEGDLFKVDLRPATAVTLYLLPDVNIRLRPKLMKELRPGTPVVSHAFDMGDWEPEVEKTIDGARIYLWHIPARASGVWEYRIPRASGPDEQHRLHITSQDVDKVQGTVTMDGQAFAIENGRVSGERLSFTITRTLDGATVTQRFEGRLAGDRIADMTIADNRTVAQQGRPTARN